MNTAQEQAVRRAMDLINIGAGTVGKASSLVLQATKGQVPVDVAENYLRKAGEILAVIDGWNQTANQYLTAALNDKDYPTS